MILHLRAAVQQLYAAGLGDFMTVRSALVAEAKRAGDAPLAKQIGALRKPTVAAWALNHFVRTDPEGLAELRSFAEMLREAQRTLDADQLRVLGRERAKRIDAVGLRVAAAATEAGQPLSPAVLTEVHETLVAFIADEEAERAILSGSLVKSLTYSGFGSVDVEDAAAYADDEDGSTAARSREFTVVEGGAAADTDPGPAVDLDEHRAKREARREAEREAKREAERRRLVTALAAARDAARDADRRVAVLAARQEEVEEGIADLERRLATARERLAKVTAELAAATTERDTREAAEQAAEDALTRHDDA